MYGIFPNIGLKNHPNVGKYTIHGAYMDFINQHTSRGADDLAIHRHPQVAPREQTESFRGSGATLARAGSGREGAMASQGQGQDSWTARHAAGICNYILYIYIYVMIYIICIYVYNIYNIHMIYTYESLYIGLPG